MAAPTNGNANAAPPLPPRFYQTVSVAPDRGGFRLLLDNKPVRTPAKNEFVLPTQALADAVAAEWDAQVSRIEPATMPLTRLVNSAIDGVMGREGLVRGDMAKYAESDLLCYRAEGPQELVLRQARAWNPVLAWAKESLGADLRICEGVMPIRQPDGAVGSMLRALQGYDGFRLAALHVMTTLMGSVVLALAHAHGRLSAEEAWAAAHLDEDWQTGKWGEDAEAKARRDRRRADMQAASHLMRLLD